MVGCKASGVSSMARNAAVRSATQGPAYSSRAMASSGAISTGSAPKAAASYSRACSGVQPSAATRAIRSGASPSRRRWANGAGREYGSLASYPAITRAAASASSTLRANTDTVSIDRQAGTMPVAEMLPMVGFSPTMLPNIAGTRPDPAVSVPSAIGTIPAATAQAEPDDEPPGTRAASNTLRGTPYGLRTPTSPVANWSRLVFPSTTAPASSRRWTQGADRSGV